tara:strand:- start:1013 stop:1768 length:756 start_codon:yes stop_codon:yes gene_type:complete
MRQSTLTTFPFQTIEENGEKRRVGGIRAALPGSFQVLAIDDLKPSNPDNKIGCGYSVYFVPTQGMTPRETSAANNGVLMLVKRVFDDTVTEGRPVVKHEEFIGQPLMNSKGFPMYLTRKQMATWKAELGDKKRSTFLEAVNRQWGSHADSDGLLCYGSGMPEFVTRPGEIRAEYLACLAYCEKRGKGVPEAVNDARYSLKQRKNRSDGTTWDRYLSDDGEVLAEPMPEPEPEAKPKPKPRAKPRAKGKASN